MDKIDGKFIPHLSSKMVRFSFRAASSLNFLGGGRGGLLFHFLLSVVQDWTFRAEERAKRPQRRRARSNGCFRRLGAKVCYDLWNTGLTGGLIWTIHTMNDLIFSFEKKTVLGFCLTGTL